MNAPIPRLKIIPGEKRDRRLFACRDRSLLSSNYTVRILAMSLVKEEEIRWTKIKKKTRYMFKRTQSLYSVQCLSKK